MARNALRADDVSWLLRTVKIPQYVAWLQQRFIETYTRIFSGFCLVAATKGYTLRHFNTSTKSKTDCEFSHVSFAEIP